MGKCNDYAPLCVDMNVMGVERERNREKESGHIRKEKATNK